MGYGVKYQGSVESLDGSTYTVQILERDYGGSTSTILLAEPLPIPRWGQQGQDLYTPILESSAEIHILDKPRLIQSEVFDADEDQFRLRILKSGATYWLGKILTDVFQDTLDIRPDVTRIVATDGLGQLDDIAYEKNNLTTVLAATLEILNEIGFDLNIFTSCNWYTPDMATSDNPLAVLKVNRSVLRTSEGEIYSAREALETILKRFGLQLYQSLGKWRVVQREQLRSNAYFYFEYDKDGVAVDDGSFAPAVYITESDQYPFRAAGGERTYAKAYKTTTVIYRPLVETAAVLKNGGFEEWHDRLPDNWVIGGDMELELGLNAKEGSSCVILPSYLTTSFSIPPSGYISQIGAKVIGDLHKLLIGFSVFFSLRSVEPPTLRRLFFQVKVGPYWLKKVSEYLYSWIHEDDVIGIEHYIALDSATLGEWIEYSILTDPLPGRGGEVLFIVYQPLEMEVSGQPVIEKMSLDALSVQVALVGETENEVEGIQAQSLSITAQNKANRDAEEFLIGDGPTSLTPGALIIGTDALTYDWQRGAYAPAQEPNGKSIDELLAETYLRAQKSPVELHRAAYHKRPTTGAVLEAHNVLRIGNKRYTLVYLERDLKEGTSSGEWAEIKVEDWDMVTGVSALTKEGITSTFFGDKKDVGSRTFASGFLGSGWKIAYDSKTGRYTMTIDNIVVRNKLSAYELLIQQVRATNGSLWITSTGKVKRFVEVV